MRKLDAMIMPDDPAMHEAMEALKRYHKAQEAGKPKAEIERLRHEAEQYFQSINDYQLAVLGHQPLLRH